MSFIVKIILLKMQVPKDANFNSVLKFYFFGFDAWIYTSNEESDENNVRFGYDIQNTCGFHLGFHWVSTHARDKFSHFSLAIKSWIINKL